MERALCVELVPVQGDRLNNGEFCQCAHFIVHFILFRLVIMSYV